MSPFTKMAKNIEAPGSWWKFWSSMCCYSTNSDIKCALTCKKILLVAFDEIYHRGFQSASLNNILRNTGTTKVALYHYLINKMELGYAVVDEIMFKAEEDNWLKPLNKTEDLIKVIQEVFTDTTRIMTEDEIGLGCPLNNLTQEMSLFMKVSESVPVRFSVWKIAIEK